MKRNLTYLFLILVCLTSCEKTRNIVTLSGKFIGQVPKEIRCTVPVNGICDEYLQTSQNVDSLGNFEFRFDLKKPSFITLLLPRGKMRQLILDPGENYHISIEPNNHKNLSKVVCKNPEVQQEYQKLVSPMFLQDVTMKFWNLPIATVENETDSLYNKEIETFENLLNEGKISTNLFDLIKLDRKLFYSSVLGETATIKFVRAIKLDRNANIDSIKEMWEKAVLRIPLDTANLLSSKWAYSYLQNYLRYQEYIGEKYHFSDRSAARKKGLLHTYILDVAKSYLNGKTLEFYDASYIISVARQHKYEKELIALYKSFNVDFPHSIFSKYLEPHIKEIVDFHKRTEQKFNEASKFLENYEHINSLAQCVKQFRGQKVYVDLWATWCGPCKRQFAYSDKLHNLLKSKNIVMLYISTNRDKDDLQWKNMIKYYNLAGYHVRANKKFKEDLKKIIGRFGIPRY
ncbi:MAG TPA: TlpA disulfide reductase family protein, partial [Sunxiuqinia sp.]|nr:TlpA disulfide reductase family protein [Sunxiuqinia sp.]